MVAPGGWNAIPGRPRLLVAAAGDEGPQGGLVREYAIEGDHMLVGRTAESTIRLTDTRVSRRHGEITRLAGAANGMDVYLYRDLDSTNGSLVNGQRVSRAELRDGDQIQLGSTTLVFRVDPVGYRGYGPGQR
jgi:pSer/pThr/pTyr-binding forkhead associated (FHA) protein